VINVLFSGKSTSYLTLDLSPSRV